MPRLAPVIRTVFPCNSSISIPSQHVFRAEAKPCLHDAPALDPVALAKDTVANQFEE
jgi:hypothetical protein